MQNNLLTTATLLLFLLLTATRTPAQTTVIRGTVLAGATAEGIPYVNIGIRKKGMGTAANADGTFTLALSSETLHDTLTFSAIGYRELSLPIQSVVESQQRQFILAEKPMPLQEVVVLGKAPKLRRLGVTYKLPFLFGSAETRNSHDISELAAFIPVHGKHAALVSTSVYLKSTKADSANFRINFYESMDGKPGARLLEKSIVRRLPLTKGWVTVNLQPYHLMVEDDFFVGFEYLPDSRRTDNFLFFYGAVLGGRLFARNVSLGAWRETAGGRMSAYVTVRQ
ncbi:carboxypeptidase-like regulatory domain-containing protein [Pontibacter chitinilyticus]|uniref:carboxypeptidase-like regulatory domain-containing protein n=1 Tax=Pontibacter chitinilyticus TaxID=2674989 RepID=UPI0032192283